MGETKDLLPQSLPLQNSFQQEKRLGSPLLAMSYNKQNRPGMGEVAGGRQKDSEQVVLDRWDQSAETRDVSTPRQTSDDRHRQGGRRGLGTTGKFDLHAGTDSGRNDMEKIKDKATCRCLGLSLNKRKNMNLDLDTCLQYKKKCQTGSSFALISNTNTKIKE